MKCKRKRKDDAREMVTYIRYVGGFQCLCGGKYPIGYVMYRWDELREWREKGLLREMVKIRRKNAMYQIQWLAEESELCHEDHKS